MTESTIKPEVHALISHILKETEKRTITLLEQANAGDFNSMAVTMKGPFESIIAALCTVEEDMINGLTIGGDNA